MAESDPIVVIGGGLAGAMFALMMARRGMRVEVYEKRPDFRVEEDRERAAAEAAQSSGDTAGSAHLGQSIDPTKRSINLALSVRGQRALEAVGVLDRVMSGVVEMPCRAIHQHTSAGSRDMRIVTQPYGKPGEAIYSASRSLLNRSLLDACDTLPNVQVFFEYSLRSLDADGNVVVEGPGGARRSVRARVCVGADGAYSAVRNAMLRLSRMDYSRQYIEHGYKELNMPPVRGDFAMPTPGALHIWPRHSFMMIALPNPDATFTCTLFAPWSTLDALEADPSKVRPFFEEHFPDAVPLLPELERQFATHPSSALVITKCNPWNFKDRVMLVGDAAHATVPFYGQGANAAFEDCLFFTEVLDRVGGDLSRAVPMYAEERKPAGDGLQQLSLDNYVEMRHKTASTFFLLQKQVEGVLQWALPATWIPQYSMVAFTRIPYHEVITRAERQERILFAAAAGIVAAGVGLAAWGALRLAKAGAFDGLLRFRQK